MITYEERLINNKKFYYANSEKYYIQKVGTEEVYYDAYDLVFTEYVETEQIKEDYVEPDTDSAEQL